MEQNVTLPIFMEKYFGEIKSAREFLDVGPSNDKFYVVAFDCFEGIRTYATLGLSKKDLYYIKNGVKEFIKEELLFSVKCVNDSRNEDEKYMKMLAAFVSVILENDCFFIPRGEIFNTKDPIVMGTDMSAFYISYPTVYLEKGTRIIYERTNPVTLIMWLIPIYKEEVDFIKEEGWSKFEDILVNKNPDLFDLHRPVLV